MRIACFGSGPACFLLGLAIKRKQNVHDVTIFQGKPSPENELGIALPSDPRQNTKIQIEALLGKCLPLHRWSDTEVVQRGARTKIAGALASGILLRPLLGMLKDAAKAAGCATEPADSFDEADLSSFDVVAVEDSTASQFRERFAFDVRQQPTRSVLFPASCLAADRVIEVVEAGGAIFFGHGFAVSERQAVYFAEATEQAWASQHLLDATPGAVAKFVSSAFSQSLAHQTLSGGSALCPTTTTKAGQWCDGNVVLLGGASLAVHRSFLFRNELMLADALELAAALVEERDVGSALARYEKNGRRIAGSAERASEAEINWVANLHRYIYYDPLQFSFAALTRSMRVNHRDLERMKPVFVREVDQRFAGIPVGCDLDPPLPMFVPFTFRSLTLDNRIGVSPMCMYMAEDGTVNDFHLVHLGSCAAGGAGLVFTEMSNVSPEGRITPGCAGMYKPQHVDAWRRIVDYVHAHTSAKIAIQLGHAGRRAATARPWDSNSTPLSQSGWTILAPSAIPYAEDSPVPREMTAADIRRVVDDFARATRWSEEAGFDLLEIHMAHGYLLSAFLSPLSNHRADEFGGSLENRARFPLEVMRIVRGSWPAEKPLSVRISAVDWSPGGNTIEDMIEFSRMLKEAGADIIDVSTGNVVNVRRPAIGRVFQTSFSDQIRNEVKIPTMTVGRIVSYGDINAILASGRADLCLLARAHLKDPYFTRHAAETLGYNDLKWPNPYARAREFVLRKEM
jgi:anthraniloyl-CoA monooxygenase